MNRKRLTRRDFIAAGSAAAVTVAAVSTGMVNCVAPVNNDSVKETYTFDISKPEFEALNTIGGSAYCELNDPDFPAIVTRTAQNEVKAYSSKCTHSGCKINLPDGAADAHCPCHDSKFNSSGKVTSGPATNQPTFSAVISGNILTITG